MRANWCTLWPRLDEDTIQNSEGRVFPTRFLSFVRPECTPLFPGPNTGVRFCRDGTSSLGGCLLVLVRRVELLESEDLAGASTSDLVVLVGGGVGANTGEQIHIGIIDTGPQRHPSTPGSRCRPPDVVLPPRRRLASPSSTTIPRTTTRRTEGQRTGRG